MSVEEIYFSWTPEDMIEVQLEKPDDFLKIKETLTRIGATSFDEKVIWQSCMILHKRGTYYIVHYKELYFLDGENSTLTLYDIQRRNTIAWLLQEWNLLKIVEPHKFTDKVPVAAIKIIPFKDKKNWDCRCLYQIGLIKQKFSQN